MKKLALSSLFIALLLTACKNDDDDVACQLSSSSIVGTYKITAITYKPTPTSADVDIYATLDACEKDDLLVLNDNGIMNYQDAGTVCSPSGSYSGSWSLTGNSITIDGDPGTVSSFDCSTLVLTQADPSGTGVSTIRLARQ